VADAIRTKYGKPDKWAPFAAERAAALETHAAREAASTPYIIWLRDSRYLERQGQASARTSRQAEYVDVHSLGGRVLRPRARILDRLADLGFEDEVEFIRGRYTQQWGYNYRWPSIGKWITTHPFVTTSRPLTERGASHHFLHVLVLRSGQRGSSIKPSSWRLWSALARFSHAASPRCA
jgi:hypothetical protein